MLIISETAKISPKAEIEDSIRGTKIIIEEGVWIDSFVKIKPVGGSGDISIGKDSCVNSGTVIYSGTIEGERTEIDLTDHASGIYFIRIGTMTKKIIKE